MRKLKLLHLPVEVKFSSERINCRFLELLNSNGCLIERALEHSAVRAFSQHLLFIYNQVIWVLLCHTLHDFLGLLLFVKLFALSISFFRIILR